LQIERVISLYGRRFGSAQASVSFRFDSTDSKKCKLLRLCDTTPLRQLKLWGNKKPEKYEATKKKKNCEATNKKLWGEGGGSCWWFDAHVIHLLRPKGTTKWEWKCSRLFDIHLTSPSLHYLIRAPFCYRDFQYNDQFFNRSLLLQIQNYCFCSKVTIPKIFLNFRRNGSALTYFTSYVTYHSHIFS
jgi:hypothetical protein